MVSWRGISVAVIGGFVHAGPGCYQTQRRHIPKEKNDD
jgi:hypothetical protein